MESKADWTLYSNKLGLVVNTSLLSVSTWTFVFDLLAYDYFHFKNRVAEMPKGNDDNLTNEACRF